jgi:hypothetical protein
LVDSFHCWVKVDVKTEPFGERERGRMVSRPLWMCWGMIGGSGGVRESAESDTKKIGSNIHFKHQTLVSKRVPQKKSQGSNHAPLSVKNVLESHGWELSKTSLTDFWDPILAEIQKAWGKLVEVGALDKF